MIGNADDLVHWLIENIRLNPDKRDKLYEIKEFKKKRSLDANKYAWHLIGEIADAMRSSKDEIYRLMLKRYGQSEIVSVLSDVDLDGYFKYFEPVGTAVLNDKNFTHYKVYKGSSEFNTREMAILIDGIVSEAELLGIETITPAELMRLKEMWNVNK